MIIESQVLDASQATNALLGQLLAEVPRTNQLLEWVGQVAGAQTIVAAPAPPHPTT